MQLNIDREKASLIGLSAKDVVDNVITAMTSDGMVAPSYWIDPKSGNNYMVTVQYANRFLNNMSMEDFENIPLRGVRPAGYSPMQKAHEASSQSRELSSGDHTAGYTPLRSVADIKLINTPTEVDHYQIRRVIDIYVSTRDEALQRVGGEINRLVANTKTDKNTVLKVRGAVVSMNRSFAEFGLGLIIAVLMVYLILMAQFTSFIDPFIILMAIPPGLAGVVLILLVTGSTLNIMSLMGVIMMTGIVVSNSILIVEFAGTLHKQGLAAAGSRCSIVQDPAAPDSDDLAGDLAGHDSDGARNGGRQRAICAAGARGHRRTGSFRGRNRLSGAGSLSDHSRPTRKEVCGCGGGIRMMNGVRDRRPYIQIRL